MESFDTDIKTHSFLLFFVSAGIAAFLFFPLWIWYGWRIELKTDTIAVLIKKTGTALESGQIIATEENQKGIRLPVLSEGRYFYNPFVWDWSLFDITDIPEKKLAVLTRLYGKELPHGRIIAHEGEKGIVEKVLRPGKYRINPYAYSIQYFDATTISAGSVGVVTALTGKDIFSKEKPAVLNDFLVKEGDKGIQKTVLQPGTYYLNPYIYRITPVNIQSQRFEMSGDSAINFLSLDGFDIMIEGTIEWGIRQEDAAYITMRVGDMDDILQKIILPRARGFSRIEGSKKKAIDYIVGETRQEFQDNLYHHLKEQCESRGVLIKSVLIRNIIPPDQIASIIRERQVAVQNRKKYDEEIIEARSMAELARQEELAHQNKEKVQQETIKIQAVISAQEKQSVALIEAEKELAVSQTEKEAAEFQSDAKLARAQAESDVIIMQGKAEGAALQKQIKAFGDGHAYAYYSFVKKIAPTINYIFASDTSYIADIIKNVINLDKKPS